MLLRRVFQEKIKPDAERDAAVAPNKTTPANDRILAKPFPVLTTRHASPTALMDVHGHPRLPVVSQPRKTKRMMSSHRIESQPVAPPPALPPSAPAQPAAEAPPPPAAPVAAAIGPSLHIMDEQNVHSNTKNSAWRINTTSAQQHDKEKVTTSMEKTLVPSSRHSITTSRIRFTETATYEERHGKRRTNGFSLSEQLRQLHDQLSACEREREYWHQCMDDHQQRDQALMDLLTRLQQKVDDMIGCTTNAHAGRPRPPPPRKSTSSTHQKKVTVYHHHHYHHHYASPSLSRSASCASFLYQRDDGFMTPVAASAAIASTLLQ
ncbi:hypothetical protein BC940DRAFT_349666 [Gongronella butleri]|nr:hypothetical protein BC940DRAFT_349666 [Gongronella butleri]